MALGAETYRSHQVAATLDSRLIRRYHNSRDLDVDDLVQLRPGQKIHHQDRDCEHPNQTTEHYPEPLEYLERESRLGSTLFGV